MLFLLNDDKARVPLGLASASLQFPILMHLEYEVRLADHNFVAARHHKLIPSVYGVREVKPNDDVSYSGDTFIRIRSSNMTVQTHIPMLIIFVNCSNATSSILKLYCF